jgi:hypothetical protein
VKTVPTLGRNLSYSAQYFVPYLILGEAQEPDTSRDLSCCTRSFPNNPVKDARVYDKSDGTSRSTCIVEKGSHVILKDLDSICTSSLSFLTSQGRQLHHPCYNGPFPIPVIQLPYPPKPGKYYRTYATPSLPSMEKHYHLVRAPYQDADHLTIASYVGSSAADQCSLLQPPLI